MSLSQFSQADTASRCAPFSFRSRTHTHSWSICNLQSYSSSTRRRDHNVTPLLSYDINTCFYVTRQGRNPAWQAASWWLYNPSPRQTMLGLWHADRAKDFFKILWWTYGISVLSILHGMHLREKAHSMLCQKDFTLVLIVCVMPMLTRPCHKVWGRANIYIYTNRHPAIHWEALVKYWSHTHILYLMTPFDFSTVCIVLYHGTDK